MSNASKSHMSQLIGEGARSVTTILDEMGRLEQALLDLSHCGATSVAVTHCPSPSRERSLAKELGAVSKKRGFVFAQVALDEHPIDAIDQLVAALLDALTSPHDRRAGGILRLLQIFFEKHGRRSAEVFASACDEAGASGDLQALCAAYLAYEGDGQLEVAALTRWADGVPLKGKLAISGVRGTLNLHTGQRVLGELTRVLRALGYAGLSLVLSGADAIASRTERQREKAYTLLRELVDNFDSGHGAVATRITITGGDAFFLGERSIQSLAPLYARISVPSDAEPPPPHRTWTSLIKEPFEYVHRRPKADESTRPEALRSLVRISQGLPPIDAVVSMSVGHERVDKSIDKLFHHAEMAGSVFQVLSGEYGSGKTHVLLHLAERALAQGHPVLWLNLERMNLDLGNPARHLARVLEQSVLPRRGRPSALSRLEAWTRSAQKQKALISALSQIALSGSQESRAAKKALAEAENSDDPGSALEEYLSARDLTDKSAGGSYRKDAYRRLLLMMELLRKLEGVEGPVVLIDEAENLYTSGVPEAARRSALRTLSFYCGGALPGACVILAMTPPALAQLRKESKVLLRDAAETDSTLDLEDVELFRHRLSKLSPDEVPAFTGPMRRELAKKVRATHRSVRGAVEFEEWDELVTALVREGGSPRAMMRRLVDELEAAWWAGD